MVIRLKTPFLLFLMLLVAYPLKCAIRRMKDGRLKRFLLFSW